MTTPVEKTKTRVVKAETSHRVSKGQAAQLIHERPYTVSPAVVVLRDKPGSLLQLLPDVLLAVVSRLLSNRPETRLLETLVQSGRVPQPILVEMARMSCSGRRLRWQKGRFMCTTLKCHRRHCRWRRQGKACITDCSKYTTAKFIKACFRIQGVPEGCWNQRVVCGDGEQRLYIETVFSRLGLNHPN